MHFPATNKFLMTVPRRGTTHPGNGIPSARRFPATIAHRQMEISSSLAYPFSFANLVEGQLYKTAKLYVSISTEAAYKDRYFHPS